MNAAQAPAKQHELVGAILSRKYTLKRAIGSGGMGTVFESTNPDDGRPCAIKLLSAEYLNDLEVIQRFIEEGRVCQRLIHPNIVRVFETATAEDGSPYLVMELLEGVPLSAYTRSGIRVPIAQAAAILQGILAGLGAAHAQGIVHRDLKPENVVLAREPSGTFTAKILDFGIAKVMDTAGGMGSKTKTGVLLGTPAYMSPEQIKNAKEVDARSDLWSAGVLLYEMLTGRVAFPAPTEYARLGAVLNTTPPVIETVDPTLARLSTVVQHAMQKDRAARYPSALEMARALSAASGDGAISSSHGGATPISRLPDVPSVFMPMQAAPVSPHVPPAAHTIIETDRYPPVTITTIDKGPGGTLASRPGRPVTEPPPQVIMAGTQGTLPSENLPMLMAHGSRRGIAVWAVVVLVLGALVAGFLLGLATARLH